MISGRTRSAWFSVSAFLRLAAFVCAVLTINLTATAQLPDAFVRAQAAYDRGDYDAAINLLIPIAESGHTLSQSLLGYSYVTRDSSQDDVKKGMEWFRLAATSGDASAQFFLGATYHNGWSGYPQDYEEGAKWTMLAARQGVDESQAILSFYYAEGFGGLPKSPVKAACWSRRAAEQGHAGAQFNLGRAAIIGEGVPKDYVEAYMWLNLAAAQGIEGAVTLRDTLRPVLTSDQVAEAQRASTKWRSRAETLGSPTQTCD